MQTIKNWIAFIFDKSWIVLTITLYFLSTVLYGFHDDIFNYHKLNFWDHWFWICTLSMSILAASWNFKRNKSDTEISFIFLFVIFRLLALIYYIIGVILDKEQWMNTHAFFWSILALSSVSALFFYLIRKHENKH